MSGGTATGTSLTGLGMLTLTANPTLAFAGSSGTIVFSGFTPGRFALNVTSTEFGTTSASADGGNDRLIFAADESANLGLITFNGVADAREVRLGGGFFEIEPLTVVPEPGTGVATICWLGLSAAACRRFRKAAYERLNRDRAAFFAWSIRPVRNSLTSTRRVDVSHRSSPTPSRESAWMPGQTVRRQGPPGVDRQQAARPWGGRVVRAGRLLASASARL